MKESYMGPTARYAGSDSERQSVGWLVLYDDGPKQAVVTAPGERTGPRRALLSVQASEMAPNVDYYMDPELKEKVSR